MDSRVTARFFRVSQKPAQTKDFHDLLLDVMTNAKTPGDRERELDGPVTVRLERCESKGDFVFGEFCRKQTVNIPASAGPSGLSATKMEKDHGLGHTAAFRYHVPTRVLLYQYNPQSVSLLRVAGYVAHGNPAALFTFLPVLRNDAWDRFVNKNVREMEVSFASVGNLEALDQEGVAAAKGARLMAEAYDGITVRITVGVGKKRKSFLNFKSVQSAVTKLMGSSASVASVQVKTDDDHDPKINFLKEHLKVSKEIELPEGNPDNNYEVRKLYLATEFSGKLDYINKLYGEPKK